MALQAVSETQKYVLALSNGLILSSSSRGSQAFCLEIITDLPLNWWSLGFDSILRSILFTDAALLGKLKVYVKDVPAAGQPFEQSFNVACSKNTQLGSVSGGQFSKTKGLPSSNLALHYSEAYEGATCGILPFLRDWVTPFLSAVPFSVLLLFIATTQTT